MPSEKQYEVLNWAFSYLKEHQREEKVAEILLQHHLNVSRTSFFMEMRQVVPADVITRFQHDIKEHALFGVPVQHLIGYAEFFGRKFTVNKHVLVPRFETEELVEHVIDKVKDDGELTIVDVGTGSGVIAISLALKLPRATVYAIDISAAALAVAQENAAQLGANVTFLQGDFLQPIIEAGINPDVIVSNPPYIRLDAEVILADTVKDFDPHLALFGGEDGLDAYREIIRYLASLGEGRARKVFFEIGYDQGELVKRLIRSTFPKSEVVVLKDLNENNRIVSVTL